VKDGKMRKPLVQVAAGIIRNEFSQIYLTQRLEGQDFAQSLEFPGGKVDKGETPENNGLAAEEIRRCEEMGVQVNTVLQLEQLVRDDNLVFAATGITHGDLLKGIRRKGNLATTETLLIRGKSRTIRRIQSTHYLDRKDTALSRLIGA